MSKRPGTTCSDAKSWQFSTRTLLVGTALCAVLVLVLQHVSAIWGAAIIWFLVLAAAHVAANVRGAHGPAHLDQAARFLQDEGAMPLPRPPGDLARMCAPPSRLRDQRRFGRMLLLISAMTALVGSVSATTALLLATTVDPGGIVLGGISAAVLGGLLGFVASSFAMVATRSFREAADPHHAVTVRSTPDSI